MGAYTELLCGSVSAEEIAAKAASSSFQHMKYEDGVAVSYFHTMMISGGLHHAFLSSKEK